ncbi:tyrosine-type recombinase/integrase [Nocardia fluminea]|uniref:tyrosine-type recombinase/integrase n=1 Tax=Nocardia fluminea TaxID=134984 RepID=UPI00342A406B
MSVEVEPMTIDGDVGAADQSVLSVDIQNLMLSGLAAPTLRAFVAALQVSALATKTQLTYAERVHDFLRWLDASRHPAALTTLAGLDAAAAEYVTGLPSRDVADSTLNVSLAALDALGRWLGLGSVTAPRAIVDQIIPKTLDQRQHSALLSAAAARPLRDYALISIGLDAGPRQSELAALDVDDIELDPAAGRGRARLTSPNKAQRVVPLGAGCVAVLNVLLADRRRTLGTDHRQRALFIGSTRANRLSERSIDRVVREVGRSASPPMEISPSTLRNTCEARLLSAGRNLVEVATLMGQQQPNIARVRALVPSPQMELDFDA